MSVHKKNQKKRKKKKLYSQRNQKNPETQKESPWDTHYQFSIKTLLSKKERNLGYPPSVFNKNSTLKEKKERKKRNSLWIPNQKKKLHLLIIVSHVCDSFLLHVS